MKREGVTLVELLVVIVIIAILVSLILPVVYRVVNRNPGQESTTVEAEAGYAPPSLEQTAGDFVLPPNFEGEAKFYITINNVQYEILYRDENDVSIQRAE